MRLAGGVRLPIRGDLRVRLGFGLELDLVIAFAAASEMKAVAEFVRLPLLRAPLPLLRRHRLVLELLPLYI